MKTMWLFLAMAAGTISFTAWAGNELSTTQIRERVRQGEILSLEAIMLKHRTVMQGKLLDLEVENEHGRIIYEMEFLQKNGDVMKLEVDARNGEILEQEIER